LIDEKMKEESLLGRESRYESNQL